MNLKVDARADLKRLRRRQRWPEHHQHARATVRHLPLHPGKLPGAGNYRIIETQPPGYTDGKESRDPTVIPNTIGTDFIDVVLKTETSDSIKNNFGELKPSSISGHVYADTGAGANYNNGHRDAGEAPIVTFVTLEGILDDGRDFPPIIMQTDASGYYFFGNLRPGTYTLRETQPAGWLDGKDAIGTPGGTSGNDLFTNIRLPQNYNGVNNDFGELPAPSHFSISGLRVRRPGCGRLQRRRQAGRRGRHRERHRHAHRHGRSGNAVQRAPP